MGSASSCATQAPPLQVPATQQCCQQSFVRFRNHTLHLQWDQRALPGARSTIVGIMQALIEIAGISGPKNSQLLIFSDQTVRNAWSSSRLLYLIGCSLGQQQDLPGACPSGTQSQKDSSSPTAERSYPLSCNLANGGSTFWLERLGQQCFKWRSCASGNAVSRPVPASCMNEQRSSQLRIACSLGPLQAKGRKRI